jgi:hypothetical protein
MLKTKTTILIMVLALLMVSNSAASAPVNVNIVGKLMLTDGSSFNLEAHATGMASALTGKAVITPVCTPQDPCRPSALVADITGFTDGNMISLNGQIPIDPCLPFDPLRQNPYSNLQFNINADMSDGSITLSPLSESHELLATGTGNVMIQNMQITYY